MKSRIISTCSIAASVLTLVALGCTHRVTSTTPAPEAKPTVTVSTNDLIRVDPLPVPRQFKNQWTPELEAEFWQRANEAIDHFAGKDYGSTYGENEKRSYAMAMLDFVAGDREKALEFLQAEDAQAGDHEHTEGIDYYYAFTLKGQIRKYFFLGEFLDPDYKQRMYDGAKRWTEEDPNGRPHPQYGMGKGGEGWGPEIRGSWVDGRNTDNLRAMREVAVYLMAEETGNEEVRQQYKQKLQRYVWALYNIGMGEWDSENYHGHTFAPYLNLYDFAKDPEVKQLSKAALDWLSAAAAVKYYHGGWGGPSKRDYGKANVAYGSAAARLFWLYFGDAPQPNPAPERDVIHLITSAYRPPQAVVALARKQFDKPVELLSTKPIYENWKEGGEDQPAYWETTFFGQTYQMGSVVSGFADGDVGPFKLMAENSQRGVDYFVANTGGDRAEPGKHKGDQIGQYRNLLVWLRPAGDRPFFFQLPQSAKAEVEENIWFFQLEKTWLAVRPINLSAYSEVALSEKWAEHYDREQTLKATTSGNRYAGFALEVGEPDSHGSYEEFKRAVKRRSRLDVSELDSGTVEFAGANGNRLKLTHNAQNERPILVRNGVEHDWSEHFNLYEPLDGNAPISLGWKTGELRVEAGGAVFETSVD